MWYIIIGAFVVYCIIYWIVSGCRAASTHLNLKKNPERALKSARKNYDNDIYSYGDYKEILIKIADEGKNKEAVLELVAITNPKDEDYYKWKTLAAQAGDFNSILELYGFTDYNFSSEAYCEILQSLDKVEVSTDEERGVIDYLRGVVHYRSGDIDRAISFFLCVIKSGYNTHKKETTYMLMLCYCKKSNLSAAEELLSSLENDDEFQIPNEGYLELYKTSLLIARDNDSNSNELSVDFANKYVNCSDVDNKSKDYNEVLYFLGREYWYGSDARLYYTANKYLYLAASNGIKEAKQIIDQYGVMGALVIPVKKSDTKYSFLYNYELKAPENLFLWNQVCRGIEFEINQLTSLFENDCNNAAYDLQVFINTIGKRYAEYLAEMIDWGIKLLMRFDIDSYCCEDILSMCDDLSLLPRVPNFQKRIDAIDRRAEQLNVQTAYSKATRGYWTGAGFGTTIGGAIGAAVESSIAAGIMNAGSGILHGIGDCIVDAINNSEIKSMGKSAIDKPEKRAEFISALKNACIDISSEIMEILSSKSNITFTSLSGEIVYNGENISALNDKVLNSKLQNHTSAQNYSYLYPLMLEKLRRTPIDAGIYNSFVLLNIRLLSEDESSQNVMMNLTEYAKDFGIDTSKLKQDLENITSD